jgi:hypothetical protein
MADIIQRFYDPLSEVKEQKDLYEFKHFVKIEALLPKNKHFIHIEPPHTIDRCYEITGPEKDAKVLSTEVDGNYFQIYLDIKGRIKCITYYGESGLILTKNICKLYNVHERNLIGMLSRYRNGLIQDFTKFLNETWAFPLYHEGYKQFAERELKMEILKGRKFSETREKMEGNPTEAPEVLTSKLKGSEIEKSLVDYLKEILPKV